MAITNSRIRFQLNVLVRGTAADDLIGSLSVERCVSTVLSISRDHVKK